MMSRRGWLVQTRIGSGRVIRSRMIPDSLSDAKLIAPELLSDSPSGAHAEIVGMEQIGGTWVASKPSRVLKQGRGGESWVFVGMPKRRWV